MDDFNEPSSPSCNRRRWIHYTGLTETDEEALQNLNEFTSDVMFLENEHCFEINFDATPLKRCWGRGTKRPDLASIRLPRISDVISHEECQSCNEKPSIDYDFNSEIRIMCEPFNHLFNFPQKHPNKSSTKLDNVSNVTNNENRFIMKSTDESPSKLYNLFTDFVNESYPIPSEDVDLTSLPKLKTTKPNSFHHVTSSSDLKISPSKFELTHQNVKDETNVLYLNSIPQPKSWSVKNSRELDSISYEDMDLPSFPKLKTKNDSFHSLKSSLELNSAVHPSEFVLTHQNLSYTKQELIDILSVTSRNNLVNQFALTSVKDKTSSPHFNSTLHPKSWSVNSSDEDLNCSLSSSDEKPAIYTAVKGSYQEFSSNTFLSLASQDTYEKVVNLPHHEELANHLSTGQLSLQEYESVEPTVGPYINEKYVNLPEHEELSNHLLARQLSLQELKSMESTVDLQLSQKELKALDSFTHISTDINELSSPLSEFQLLHKELKIMESHELPAVHSEPPTVNLLITQSTVDELGSNYLSIDTLCISETIDSSLTSITPLTSNHLENDHSKSEEESEAEAKSCLLTIKNLPLNLNKMDLWDFMLSFGKVDDVILMEKKISTTAWIKMECSLAGKWALNCLHDAESPFPGAVRNLTCSLEMFDD